MPHIIHHETKKQAEEHTQESPDPHDSWERKKNIGQYSKHIFSLLFLFKWVWLYSFQHITFKLRSENGTIYGLTPANVIFEGIIWDIWIMIHPSQHPLQLTGVIIRIILWNWFGYWSAGFLENWQLHIHK